MKLKNKKTGEIVRVEFLSNWQTDDGTEIGFRECNTNIVYSYNSLAELNEEWEDVAEEPKEFYWIDYDGEVKTFVTSYEWQEKMKEIGNYFETKEEAEKAAEHLRAWKRLKDKGFKFGRWQFLDDRSGVWVRGNYAPDIVDELDILFGGEE